MFQVNRSTPHCRRWQFIVQARTVRYNARSPVELAVTLLLLIRSVLPSPLVSLARRPHYPHHLGCDEVWPSPRLSPTTSPLHTQSPTRCLILSFFKFQRVVAMLAALPLQHARCRLVTKGPW